MSEITFEIVRHIGVLFEKHNGWKKEVNLVSWNGGDPKIDIREWDESYTKMSRGLTFTQDEAMKLVDLLQTEIYRC